MYLTAFLHREKLFEITNRWISDNFLPEDPLIISQIITFDSFIAQEIMLLFTNDLLKALTKKPFERLNILQKKDLKNFICEAKHPKKEHIKKLISEYKKMSEYFYIGAPISGYIYKDVSGKILSISRFKRIKRIAEKASRYAQMYIADKVYDIANNLTFTDEIEDIEKPTDLILSAERRLMEDIKKKGITLPLDVMSIKDILGIKIVDDKLGEKKLERAIKKNCNGKIIEKDIHTGKYNAVHYIIELKVNHDYINERFKYLNSSLDYRARGLDVTFINEAFKNFLLTGKKTIQTDLILTSYEELIESEIGRSMHEMRIFKQRQQQKYFGNIPINIEYIIEYMLAVGLSPTIHIKNIPIKIWGRYLPETLSHSIRTLYHMPKYSLVND